MKKKLKKNKNKRKQAVGLSMALALAISSMPGNVVFDWRPAVVKAADSTISVDSTAIVQQIDFKEQNRPGIPDGILLNELKRLVNTSLNRPVTNDITYGELMSYSGNIDLSGIGSQITSIKGLGYARKANKIVLTNVPIKTIEDFEFDTCTGLTEIVLPAGLETIGKSAFRNCNKLSQIVLPETVTTIGEAAFDTCTSLKNFTIPTAVSNIGKSAFSGCTGLTEMTIPNSNVVLGASVFEGCTNLATVHLPEGITDIPASFFASSGIKNLQVPVSVKEIKQGAFSNTNALLQLDLSKCTNLETLGSNAFARSLITSIALPSSLRTIENNAFDTSALLEINIPDSVQGAGNGVATGGIGRNAFWNCRLLKKVSLPSGISALQDETFKGCWNLKEVEIRNAENSTLEKIGTGAFAECNQLENTDFLKNLRNLKTIEDEAFTYEKITDKEKLAQYELLTGQKNKLDKKNIYNEDQYIAGLHSVVLPDSVTTLGKDVFKDQPNIQTVALGNGLTEIPEKTFKDCIHLEKVTLPAYLKEIKASSFENCNRLKEITFPNTLEAIGDSAFSNCGAVKTYSVTYDTYYVKPEQVYTQRPAGNTTAVECLIYTKDENYNQKFSTVFMEKGGILNSSAYKKKGNPAGYTSYAVVAEKYYADAAKVYSDKTKSKNTYTQYAYDETTGRITENNTIYTDEFKTPVLAKQGQETGYFVKMTGNSKISVRDYYGLTSINLPNNVKTIGKKAFYNCYKLGDIILSNRLTDIEEAAFAVDKKENLNKYDWVAEKQKPLTADYIAARKVKLPENLQNIKKDAFKYNGNLTLTSEKFPDSLLEIGDSAFEECHSLESIVIPSKTKSIGKRAFYGCSEYETEEKKVQSYDVVSIPEKKGLKEINLTQAASLTSIGEYAFARTAITQCSLPVKVTSVEKGVFADCPLLAKVICSDETTIVKDLAFSNCLGLVSITIPAKAVISYNAFKGYDYSGFSFVITDPEPISVTIGEEEKLPVNTLLKDYLRGDVQVTEKNGTTGFIEIVKPESEKIDGFNIYKAKVKGLSEGTTKLSIVGTNNFALYGTSVLTKSIEVTATVNATKKKCTDIVDEKEGEVLSVENVGSQIRLQPQVLPADCTELNEWSSDNVGVVEVIPDTSMSNGQMVTNSSAVIIPKALGTGKITLRTGSVKKEYQINVVVPAASVALDQNEGTLKEGKNEKIKLNASMTYDTAKYSENDWKNFQDIISYSSANPSIAKVSSDGEVEAVSAGETEITATALGSKKTAVFRIKVLPDETGVTFVDEQGKAIDLTKPLNVQAKDIVKLNIATEPADSLSELTWEFSEKDMFTHLKNETKPIETEDKIIKEKVTAMQFQAEKIGTGTITVFPKKYKNKERVAATIQVNVLADTQDAAFATVNGVEVQKEAKVFGYLLSAAGKAQKIEDVKKVTTDQVTFLSSDPAIVSIDSETGVVKGLKEGHVTITMQITNPVNPEKNIVKTMGLDVTVPDATDIIVKEQKGLSVVNVGKTLQLETTLVPSNAQEDVKYESVYPEIASVDKNGKIKALKAGTGKIKVTTAKKGISKEFTFTVTDNGTSGTPAPAKTSAAGKVSGIKAVNIKGKKLKVTWKKVKNAKGYRITYALDKKFTKGRKTVNIPKNSVGKTISKLKKGKTYYIKVQAYVKDGTKKVYGKPSTVSQVKIKK